MELVDLLKETNKRINELIAELEGGDSRSTQDVVDKVFANRLANELFIAMQKNDIYEQVKFETPESIKETISRLKERLTEERKKLDALMNPYPEKDIVIPEAEEFNELQKDADKAVDDILEERKKEIEGALEKYRSFSEQYVAENVYVPKNTTAGEMIYDNMTPAELYELTGGEVVHGSHDPLYKKAIATMPDDMLLDIVDRMKQRHASSLKVAKPVKGEGDANKVYASNRRDAIGLGRPEAERKETFQERAKKAFDKFRGK